MSPDRERLQRLIDTKLELQNERNRLETMQNRYAILFLTAPVWGKAADTWTSENSLTLNLAVSAAVMLAGAVGWAYHYMKKRQVRHLTGLPVEYLSDDTRRILTEAAQKAPRITANPQERATDRRRSTDEPEPRA